MYDGQHGTDKCRIVGRLSANVVKLTKPIKFPTTKHTCILLSSCVREVGAVQIHTRASWGEHIRACARLEDVGTTAGWDKVDTSGEFSWGASVKAEHYSNTQRSE